MNMHSILTFMTFKLWVWNEATDEGDLRSGSSDIHESLASALSCGLGDEPFDSFPRSSALVAIAEMGPFAVVVEQLETSKNLAFPGLI